MGKVIYLNQHGIRRINDAPISALNITPLIDVMLVVLVMLIIALPAAMHEVKVDLPPPGPGEKSNPVLQKLVLRNDGVAFWNGESIGETALGEKLRAAATAGDELQFQTDGNARYERFDQLIALVKRSGVQKVGFVGNSQFAEWDQPLATEF
jgi:biopolymer transport protein ExbD